MAEIRKPLIKTKSTRRKSESLSGDISSKKPFNRKTQKSAASRVLLARPMTSLTAATIVAVGAGALALLALAVSVVAYRQTADWVEASHISESDQLDLLAINERQDRLMALIVTNADNYALLEQKISRTPSIDAPAAWIPADLADTSILKDVTKRLEALEALQGRQNMAPPSASARIESADDGTNTSASLDKLQIGLLAAAGLLTENLAGRQIDIWVSVFDDLGWPGVTMIDRDIIRAARDAPVDSRATLLNQGRLELALAVQSLNKAEKGAGLLSQARARVANLVQLRRIGGGTDQPTTLLTSFETALDHADFDAAYATATTWSSAGLDGLDSWLAAAQRRHNLDAAVSRLVAIFVRQSTGRK